MGFINKSKDFPRNSPNLNPSSSPEKPSFRTKASLNSLSDLSLGINVANFLKKNTRFAYKEISVKIPFFKPSANFFPSCLMVPAKLTVWHSLTTRRMMFFLPFVRKISRLPSISFIQFPGVNEANQAGPPASQQEAQRFRPSKDSRSWHFCGKIFGRRNVR